jgi:hypothetical protein
MKISELESNKLFIIMFFLFIFLFRLIYGLFSEFWFIDEQQIYLIGLKYYTTGHFPNYGPDVVYTSSQIPGGLQGFLVGFPLFILSIPESPYFFLNILNMAALFLLAVYIQKKVPAVPKWFTYIWIFTAPWVMNFGTHVVNPSYVLPAAILFFISFLESIPKLSEKLIKPGWCFFFMGLCLLWIYQLHMSWVLLMPFILTSYIYNFKYGFKKISLYIGVFLLGCLIPGLTVIPTYLKYGFVNGSGGTMSNIVFNSNNAKEVFTILVRYLSFATCEIPRFLGADTPGRLHFIKEYYLAAPFIIFATLIGFAQVLWLIYTFFSKNPKLKDIKYLTLASFVLLFLSFLFSVKNPSSHTFYVMLPLVVIYSFYCWEPLFKKRWFNILAGIFLFSCFIFHLTLGYDNFKYKSMYKNRNIPVKAIQEKNYHILGERRPWDKNK